MKKQTIKLKESEISDIVSDVVTEIVNQKLIDDGRQFVNEMAKINMKDGGTSLFPAHAYNIIVQGDNSPHKPPHIHVVSKQEGYNIKVLITTGELWQVESYGRRGRNDTFNDVIKNIKIWLTQLSQVPMAKGDTNQVFAMGLWELNNP